MSFLQKGNWDIVTAEINQGTSFFVAADERKAYNIIKGSMRPPTSASRQTLGWKTQYGMNDLLDGVVAGVGGEN